MIYHGHIANGHVVLDESAVLPEGARVRIDVVADRNTQAGSEASRDSLDKLRRKVADWPVLNPGDGFSNRDHDRLLYGEQS